MKLTATPLTSCAHTVRIEMPVRTAHPQDGKQRIQYEEGRGPSQGGTKLEERLGAEQTQSVIDQPSNAGRNDNDRVVVQSVPYHGTWPRTSRSSVVPIADTIAAATGPPSSIDARIGALATEATEPRGSFTGMALATR